jgi:uncharacterized protein YceH (UPF0502 family)
MTEIEIIRNRIRELQIGFNDIVAVLAKKHSTTAINRLAADLEARMDSLEQRIEDIEGRLTILEEEE